MTPAPRAEVHLLGGFSVSVEGVEIPSEAWQGRHGANLVKLLALAERRRLHREQVIDALWPDVPVSSATSRLHKATHFARRAIGHPESVVLDGEQLVLWPGGDLVVDVAQFECAADAALAAGDAAMATEAMATYDGDLLPDDLYEEWTAAARDRLRMRFAALCRLAERWDLVLAVDPADEEAHLAEVQTLAAAGDRHGALRRYQLMERTLADELGLPPSARARALRAELVAAPDAAHAPLRGREDELDGLRRRLARTLLGRGGTVLLTGPPGIGKTTLCEALLHEASDQGWLGVRSTCVGVEARWPYRPIIELVDDLARQRPDVLAALPGNHRTELRRARHGSSDAGGFSGHQRLFVAVGDAIRQAAEVAPLLVLIDDVQDADEASLRVLHFLSRIAATTRVLLLVTASSADATPALREITERLRRRSDFDQVPIGGLADRDIATIASMAGAPDPVLDDIVDRARGNPLVAGRLASVARSGHSLDEAPDRAADIEDHVAAALSCVVVAGSRFDLDEFLLLSGLEEEAAFALLDQLLARELIVATETGYALRHTELRTELLGRLSPHDRRRMHRRAAQRLQERGARADRVARQLVDAGAATEAVPWLRQAAQDALAVGAYRDGLDLVETAIHHAAGSGRDELRELRADLLAATGDPAAVGLYQSLARTVPASRAIEVKLARSALMAGKLDAASAALADVDLAGDELDADILLARGLLAWFQGDLESASAALGQARALPLAGGAAMLDVITLEGLLAHSQGHWFDRIWVELEDSAQSPQATTHIFDSHICVTQAVLDSVDRSEVLDFAQSLAASADRSGASRAAAFAVLLEGEARLLAGDVDDAAVRLDDALERHRRLSAAAGEAITLQRLAQVAHTRGDDRTAMRLLRDALAAARWSPLVRHLVSRIYGTMIGICAGQDARALVDEAEDALGAADACLYCSAFRAVPSAIACAAVGDVEAAERYAAEAAASIDYWGGQSWPAALTEARAHIASAAGDRQTACRLFTEAADGFQSAGQPIDSRRCRQAAEQPDDPAIGGRAHTPGVTMPLS